jgi:sRNA-binding carbon storage regulator CsrA
MAADDASGGRGGLVTWKRKNDEIVLRDGTRIRVGRIKGDKVELHIQGPREVRAEPEVESE